LAAGSCGVYLHGMLAKMKTILITGSAHGLGRELATRFARDKYNIIIHDKDKEGLETLKEMITFPGWATCDVVEGDLKERETINDLYAISKLRDIDILINNAGIRTSGSLKDMSAYNISDMISVNLIAPLQLTRVIYPIFLKKKSGMIININSIAGKNPNSDEAVYCASKYGLRGFFDSFKFEAAENNIAILSLYLGAMNTDMAMGRKDKNKLINPSDVADFVYNICVGDFKSFIIPEMDMWRKHR